MEQLTDRVAVITGAGSGIGEGLARRCASAGMKVVVADLERDQGERVAQLIAADGGEALAVPVDVSDRAAMESLARQAVERFGAVHLLCNNAGVMTVAPILETPDEDWQWTLAVNLYGVIHGIRAFVPLMLSQGEEGHIVNTASMASVRMSGGSIGAYIASKFAVLGLTEQLERELAGTNVGVSVLLPGAVATRIFQAERNRPDALGGPGTLGQTPDRELMAPSRVAELVLDAVRANRFYIFTHPEGRAAVEERVARMLADYGAVGTMSRSP